MIITQTPLRIGLLGGGTDLPDYYRQHGGRVLNCAIDKYIYVIVKQRFDDDIYVNYSKKEIVSSVEDLEHELVREAMWMTGVTNGVEITTLADIPSAGSGLGSSSAVTVPAASSSTTPPADGRSERNTVNVAIIPCSRCAWTRDRRSKSVRLSALHARNISSEPTQARLAASVPALPSSSGSKNVRTAGGPARASR